MWSLRSRILLAALRERVWLTIEGDAALDAKVATGLERS